MTKEIGQTVPSVEKSNQSLLSQLERFCLLLKHVVDKCGEQSIANPSTSNFAARSQPMESSHIPMSSNTVPTFSCSGSIFSTVGSEGCVLSSIVVLHNVRCKSLDAAGMLPKASCRDQSCTLGHPHLDVDRSYSFFTAQDLFVSCMIFRLLVTRINWRVRTTFYLRVM